MANSAEDQQPTSEAATRAEPLTASLPAGTPVVGDDSEIGDDEVTVLGPSATLEAEEFPQGLSPRELALTLKGQLLGHFHLQEFVGGGGMGAVFKALDTTLDRIVAVKVVASQSVSSEDLQRRFLVEAQSTARLDHPNIARIHYVGRDRGLPYIVFEFIDGVNLRDVVLNHGPIPIGDALSFTCQIAHALDHAWQKEVVHRDIKPSNILITHEGQAKLVDMGLARLHHVDPVDNELTNTGVTLGTFDYISPEQARDPRDADIRSDIYSLGCTLFYMLLGRPPFADGTAVQKLLQHQDQLPPDLSQLRPDVPDSMSHLAHSMLAKSPELRPQTPTELLKACYLIFHELGIQPPSTLPPLRLQETHTSEPNWKIHLPWLIPVVGLLLFAGLFGGGFTVPKDSVQFEPLRVREVSPAGDSSIEAMTNQVSEEESNSQKAMEEVQIEAQEELPNVPTQDALEDQTFAETLKNLELSSPPVTSALPPSLIEFPQGDAPEVDESLIRDLGEDSLNVGDIIDSN